jgi:hypothetical protein
MGNEQSNSSSEQESSLTSNSYTLMSTTDDKRFGRISLYKHKLSSQLIWLKEIKIDDENAYKHFKEYLESGSHLNEVFLTRDAKIIGPGSPIGALCGACGVGRKLEVAMDFLERDLEGELMRRAEDMVSLGFKRSKIVDFF